MKKVLVTGATGSIGEEIVKEYAKNGFFVYIHYNSNHQKAQNLLEEIDNKGELISFDIKDKESIKNSLENLDVDVLINNAGIIKDNLFFFMSDDEWEDVINTNLNGNFYITKIISKNMMMNKKGSIVNIASISGVSGNAGQANYSASKGGLNAMTKSFAKEAASRGIRYNAVTPGFIQTDMTHELKEEVKAEYEKNIPLSRFGQPSEIADAVAFLLSDHSSYITGEILKVNGGLYV